MISLLKKDEENRFDILTIPIADPAPGANWSLTVPAGKAYIPLAFYCVMSASAAVATRVFRLSYRFGGAVIGRGRVPVNQTASSVLAVSGSLFDPTPISNIGGISLVVPYMRLAPGTVIATDIVSLQPDDQLSQIQLTVIAVDLSAVT